MFDKAIATLKLLVTILPWIILSAITMQVVHDIYYWRIDLLDMLYVVATCVVSSVLSALVLAFLFNTE